MRLYRALLHFYPKSFRDEYGREMAADFRARRQRFTGIAVAALWGAALADIVSNAARVHVDILNQDIRYTFRSLRRSPGFAATVIVISALGIGATSTAFSIADHVLIRPLPFRAPDKLVDLWQAPPDNDGYTNQASPGNFRDWKSRSVMFESIAGFTGNSVNLFDGNIPERLDGAAVTADLFPLLGVHAEIGRIFDANDDRDGAPGTVMLSDGFWATKFSRDPSVIGRIVRLDDQPYEVIGVMPPTFRYPTRTSEIWTTLRFSPGLFVDRTNTYINVVGRIKPNVTLAQARSEMRQIGAQLEREHPQANAKVSIVAIPIRDELSSQSRLLLNAIVAASIGLLMIACANLSNILLVRGLTRRKELALRSALGAGRDRLVRQMLTESAMLSLVGGILGLAMAVIVVPLVSRLVPTSLPISETPSFDARMLGLAALVTFATGIGFGMAPILRTSRRFSPSADLVDGSRAGAGRQTERLRSALVVISVAMSVVLLVSTGLFIRALWRVQAVDPGFRTNNVLTLRTSLPVPKYQNLEPRIAFYRHVLDDVRALPGVADAAYISFLPMVMRGGIWKVAIPGAVYEAGAEPTVSLRFVTPEFFSTMSIPVRTGRDVSESDTASSALVAVVSESFTRRHWPGQNPIGQHFTIAVQDRTVVGVVGDIRVRGLERQSEPQVYLPYQQQGMLPASPGPYYAPKDLVVKVTGETSVITQAVRSIVVAADPRQPISDVRMLSDIVDGETATRSVQLRVIGGFALIACLLAAFGIHGLLSFAVSTQTREIGVRIALGAQRRDVVGLVVRRAALLAIVGLAVGAGLAALAGRSVASALAGFSAADPETFLTAIALVLAMTIAGSLGSAIRAVRIDPMRAIRQD